MTISRICEFRVIMGMITVLLGCCLSSTLGSRPNDYVKTLATLGFWLHHSPFFLGCWTNNTLAARSLSPNSSHIFNGDLAILALKFACGWIFTLSVKRAWLFFLTCLAMKTRWWEIGCHLLVKITFVPICTCHNASSLAFMWWHRSTVVTSQN